MLFRLHYGRWWHHHVGGISCLWWRCCWVHPLGRCWRPEVSTSSVLHPVKIPLPLQRLPTHAPTARSSYPPTYYHANNTNNWLKCRSHSIIWPSIAYMMPSVAINIDKSLPMSPYQRLVAMKSINPMMIHCILLTSSSVWKLLASNGPTPVDIDAITIMVEGDHGDERFSAHNVIIVAIDFGSSWIHFNEIILFFTLQGHQYAWWITFMA